MLAQPAYTDSWIPAFEMTTSVDAATNNKFFEVGLRFAHEIEKPVSGLLVPAGSS